MTRDDAYITQLVAYLSGPAYCNNDAGCISFLAPYMPLASEQLALVLENPVEADRLCTEVYDLTC